MLSADTNLLIHAADPDTPQHQVAREFFALINTRADEFVLCELILIELYMQLRNPAIFTTPYSAKESAMYCQALKENPTWRCIDYDPCVAPKLWQWAMTTKAGFRQNIDARIAFTLLHHGVTQFATVNAKHFSEFGFAKVWNPLIP